MQMAVKSKYCPCVDGPIIKQQLVTYWSRTKWCIISNIKLDLHPSPSHVQIHSLHCAAHLHFVIQEALCSMSHLVQNNYTYKRTEFFHRVTNWLNTKPTYCTKSDSTYWSSRVHQRGNIHSDTCFVNYFY